MLDMLLKKFSVENNWKNLIFAIINISMGALIEKFLN